MITPVNILLIVIWALIVPYLAGRLISMWSKSPATGLNICMNLSFGFMVMCAVFIIPAIPMILLHAPFHVLKYTWLVLMAVICTSSVVLSVKERKDGDSENEAENAAVIVDTDKADKTEEDKSTVSDMSANTVKTSVGKKHVDIFTVCVWFAAIAVIIFETGLLTVRMHTDTDDARFIVDAMEALSKDTMLEYNPITGIYHGIPVGEQVKDLTAPYPLFIALISSLTGVHPAIMAHTIMPLLYIPLSYLVFCLIGGLLFKDDIKKKGLFLFFLSLIHLFSFETIFSAGYTLLTIIWQGRSIVAMIMLPLTWYLLLKAADSEKVEVSDYVIIGISALANAMLSNMGALFAFILCMAYALSMAVQDKKLSRIFFMGLAMLPDILVIILSRLLYSGILYR